MIYTKPAVTRRQLVATMADKVSGPCLPVDSDACAEF